MLNSPSRHSLQIFLIVIISGNQALDGHLRTEVLYQNLMFLESLKMSCLIFNKLAWHYNREEKEENSEKKKISYRLWSLKMYIHRIQAAGDVEDLEKIQIQRQWYLFLKFSSGTKFWKCILFGSNNILLIIDVTKFISLWGSAGCLWMQSKRSSIS